MKQGIHLGPPLGRTAAIQRIVLVLLVVVTAFNLYDTWRARRQAAELRQAVARLESVGTGPAAASEEERAAIERMQALAASGVLETHPPTVLLSLLQVSLPPGLTLTAVTLRPGAPTSSMLVEAVAEGESDLTAFQRALAASPLVADTALLEERRTTANQLAVRLEASLEAR